MSYTPNWTTKVFTIPLGDLTFVSGVNYTLDADDFWIEIRRLEASAANNGGLYAEQALEFVNTQTLSGITYSAIVKLINSYTWEIDASNIIVSLLGINSNLLDTFVPANGVSVLANNSAGKQIISTGSGLDAGQDAKLTAIDTRTEYHDKIINNLKELIKISGSWYLVIYDTGEASGGSEILRKKMTDSTGADITDLAAGVLAAELESTA